MTWNFTMCFYVASIIILLFLLIFLANTPPEDYKESSRSWSFLIACVFFICSFLATAMDNDTKSLFSDIKQLQITSKH